MRLALALLMIPAVAAAEPSFELVDRGDAIEVIAHDVKAARTAVNPTRSRLEVELTGQPRAQALAGAGPVKVIELSGGEPRVLSVKLVHDRADVKLLARHAQAIQVGDDLHLLFPRAVPADGAVVTLPEPTLSPELAARLAGPGPRPAVAVEPSAEAAPAPAAAPAPPAAAAARTSSLAAVATKPDAGAKPATIGKPSDDAAWSNLSLYAALGLAAIGGGMWLFRRRRNGPVPGQSIEVLAQRSIGGKARIVWLAAGNREMVVAVTPQQVRMLGQWRKQDAPAALPQAHTHSDLHADTRGEPRGEPRPEAPSSAAVAGILKLRQRATTRELAAIVDAPDDATAGGLDADALWAREILSATAAHGARR